MKILITKASDYEFLQTMDIESITDLFVLFEYTKRKAFIIYSRDELCILNPTEYDFMTPEQIQKARIRKELYKDCICEAMIYDYYIE